MNKAGIQEGYSRPPDVGRLARQVLRVGEGASPSEIKRAWRKRCRETHPDRNPDDPDAERKFRLVNGAYRFLTEGVPCPDLSDHDAESGRPPSHSKYDLSNPWGFYLWWREKFF